MVFHMLLTWKPCKHKCNMNLHQTKKKKIIYIEREGALVHHSTAKKPCCSFKLTLLTH